MPPVGNRGADDGMLQANGVDRVRMFDAEPWTAGALVDTRIQIVIAVPEDQIAYVSSDPRSGRLWVRAERLLLPQDQHRRQMLTELVHSKHTQNVEWINAELG
ncbi:hypothetical protein OsI_20742 [Oryza sativa Indica Group]|uniref:Uncharacterized protein n=1 Tax=Oryza sativa subsp. indica TaxID=39946 RepID=B8B078_ORYSI|nr:glucan endo-1,3-beta-glucosidase 8-like [Oryza glaberrima]EEC79577.1 hypothetical protein OsI_20742 [Oryza sativa Indica Group]